MLKLIDGSTFSPVPVPVKEVCPELDAPCSDRNSVRDAQYSWNRSLGGEIVLGNSFIGTWNSGSGPVNWSADLTPLAQALVRGAQGLDQSVTALQPYCEGPNCPTSWVPPYETSGPSLPPPPGVPAGPAVGPPPAPATPPALSSGWPLSISAAPHAVPVGASPLMAAIYQLLPGASVAAQKKIAVLLLADQGAGE